MLDMAHWRDNFALSRGGQVGAGEVEPGLGPCFVGKCLDCKALVHTNLSNSYTCRDLDVRNSKAQFLSITELCLKPHGSNTVKNSHQEVSWAGIIIAID